MELATTKLAISTLSPIIEKLGTYVYGSYFGGDVTAEEMKRLTNVLLPKIKTVIEEAELVPSDHLRPWLEDLQDAAFEAEDFIDLYEYKKIKDQVSSLPVFIKKYRNKIKETLGFMLPKSSFKVSFEKLQKSAEEATENLLPLIRSARRQQKKDKHPQASTSTTTVSTLSSSIFFGRKEECDFIIEFLLDESYDDSNGRIERIPIIAIQGIGGSGKTTVAQKVYNNGGIVKKFDKRMWVHVSPSFDVHKLTKEIIESTIKGECPRIGNLDVLQTMLKESISNKKFLLVLDDIWCDDERQWDQLLSPLREVKGNGSKIIITTRMNKVASMLQVDHAISLKELKTEDCWSILKHYAFGNSETTIEDKGLENIGNQIISKVKHSPLALRVVGSLLYKQVSVNDWNNILRQDMLKEIMDVLLLSFQHLPSHLQRCFAYCSLFPKGYKFYIYRDELVPLWIAQGFIENTSVSELSLVEKGRTYVKELLLYSFFEEHDKYGYKIHDLLHDLAENVSKKYCHRIEENSLHVPATCIHLSMYRTENLRLVDIPDMLRLKKLRSLVIIDDSYYTNTSEYKKVTFPNLTKLRTLYIASELQMEVLNNHGIGELKHLRYLNLNIQCDDRPPTFLAELYHLQFLYLSDYLADKLSSLAIDFQPYQFLMNHLNLRTLKLPTGNEFHGWHKFAQLQITSPQNMTHISFEKKGVHGMMNLKNLTNLHGSLSIDNLQNVKSKAEAAKAMLNKKKNLNGLTFEWGSTVDNIDGSNSYEEVLEGLEPHPNLEMLSIISYQGVKASNWMKNENRLSRLLKLRLYKCESLIEVSYLPPRLEELYVVECNELMQLPPIGDTLSCLELKDCSKLMPPSMSSKSLRVAHLEIIKCARNECQLFNDLPFLTNLQHLVLEGFSNLQNFPNLCPTLAYMKIDNFPKLTSLVLVGSFDLQRYTSLSKLEIVCCPMLTDLEDLQYCLSLKKLTFWSADWDITLRLPCSIEELFLGSLRGPFPQFLEKELHNLSSLLFLCLGSFMTLPSLENLSSLKELYIASCTGVELLPSLPTSLKDLFVDDCPHVLMPNLPISLAHLTVSNCPNVELLPNLPISLKRLSVSQCPNLKVKYEEGGPLHNTISHIPFVFFQD